MNCQRVKEKMFSYLDGELGASEEKLFSKHLANCADCAAEFILAGKTHDLLKETLIPVAPPLGITEQIMARIPDMEEQADQESPGIFFGLKKYLSNLAGKEKNILSGWHVRTAVVTLGMLVLVIFGNVSGVWEKVLTPQNPKTDLAEIDHTQLPTPATKTPTTPKPTPDGSKIPEGDKPGIDGSGIMKKDEPGETSSEKNHSSTKDPETSKKGDQDSQKGQQSKPPKDKPPASLASKQDTNIVTLPKASLEETRVETIKITPLVANNTQRMSQPVLSDNGKSIHYLYDNAGLEEEWVLELKAAATPAKAENNIIKAGHRANANQPVPSWLKDVEIFKEIKPRDIAWSADKKQVALSFQGSGQDYEGLWVAQQDGTALTRVTQESNGKNLVWAPNRTKLAFTNSRNQLFVLYVRENLLIQVMDQGEELIELNHLVFLPDSKDLVFEGRQQTSNLTGIYRVTLP